ncbi:PH domain-containing protein [Paenibacillus periandrae]|uniref:PH domain-containing protein n=1 Tax=Paenibacillus periandrae TaxID=1761741 RepID=UPI001F0988AE|nr:PH domain-containing protein [Paenibacillus periandrae]
MKDTYQVDSDALHLRKGVFTKTERVLPISRINTLDLKQNYVYKLLSIAKIEIRTADSNDHSVATLVVSLRKAKEIEMYVKSDLYLEMKVENKPLFTTLPKMKEIWMMAISLKTFWLGVPVSMTLMQYVFQWVSRSEPEPSVSMLSMIQGSLWANIDMLSFVFSLGILLGSTIIVSWIFSFVVVSLKYYGWQVKRNASFLTIHYGLFESRIVRLHVSKIQSIRIKEPFICRIFGYAFVWIDCVGFEGERKIKMLLPAMKKRDIPQVLQEILPEFTLPDTSCYPLHRDGKLLAATRVSIPLFLSILFAAFWYHPILYTTIIPITIALMNLYAYNRSGWMLYKNHLVISKGGLTQSTVYVLRNSIQSISISQHSIQKRLGYSKLYIDIDSPSRWSEYRIVGIPISHHLKIRGWYENRFGQ